MDVFTRTLEDIASPEHHAEMMKAGSAHPCPIEGCRLSVEEHHRLAFGIVQENRALKRRVAELERGGQPAVEPAVQPITNHKAAISALRTALNLLEGGAVGLATDTLEGAL